MFRKVLIANRGEIATRVIRACHEMGISTVAVFSEADRDSLPVRLADEACCIGPSQAKKSYLDIARIIETARAFGADAIHPGYGFLSENAAFADACANYGITFIGPSGDAIRRMGDKAMARSTMIQAGVPVVPGTEGLITDEEEARRTALAIGCPVLIKATAGGGGKGMRVVEDPEDLPGALRQASQEAERSFGNPGVYLEKYLPRSRHVEMQIMADSCGHTVWLGERDCSTQRRHQKVIEESPSPIMTPELRRRMGEAAVCAAKAVNYCGAGTVEFIVTDDGQFYFMEMNTRIQVEHPVTEMVTGTDLVKAQILAAAGEPLPWSQQDIHLSGWAIECRINAEDPRHNFMPCPGTLTRYTPPFGRGIRVDSAMYRGCVITPFYDSMIAKLIVWAPTRSEAIDKMEKALSDFRIEGVVTNISLQKKILQTPLFRSGDMHTSDLEAHLDSILNS